MVMANGPTRRCLGCSRVKAVDDFMVGSSLTRTCADCKQPRPRVRPAPKPEPETRTCRTCKVEKPLDDFYLGRFRVHECADCRRRRDVATEQHRSRTPAPPAYRPHRPEPVPTPSDGPIVQRRECVACGQWKLLTAFGTYQRPRKKRGMATYYKSRCKQCLAAQERARKASTSEA